MIILGIDTSTPAAAAALWKDGTVSASYRLNAGKSHSTSILPMVKQMLELCGVGPADVDLFACGVGPGSFTGVRIGVSTVKGLAEAQDKPCVGVSSLLASASSFKMFSGLVVPVFNARRGNVYSAVFLAEDGSLRRLTEDMIISADGILSDISGRSLPVCFTGDSAGELFGRAKEAGIDAVWAGDGAELTDVGEMCRIAEGIYEKGGNFSPEALRPIYLRPGRIAAAAMPE